MQNDVLGFQEVLKGKMISNPIYLEQQLEEYKDNPCIEALPHIFNDIEVLSNFTLYPKDIEEMEKQQDVNVRYHMIKRLKGFIQPLDKHLKIEHTLSSMIRRGYLARNPSSKEYLLRLRLINEIKDAMKESKNTGIEQLYEAFDEKFNKIPETYRSTAESTSIIGISGMGKTTAIERLFLMYPQVIRHHEYKGRPLTRTQIVWLKVDCPYDGSLKTLCKMFFKAVDDVLITTNYFKHFGSNKNSTATMMIHMAYLASLHSIGMLAIDEMQHLINPKNNADEMLNFFVTLVNMIGIPIVYIGTPKVLSVFKKGLRQVRRAQDAGGIFWDRMNQDDEWDFFLETMWEYQWLKNYTPLTNELNGAMYFETQGITAIAVSLFILVQAQAMFVGEEKITEEMIHQVAEDDLRLTHKIIKAIRNDDAREISNYEDIQIDIDELLLNKSQKNNIKEKVKELVQQKKQVLEFKRNNTKEQLISELISLGVFKYLDYKTIEGFVDKLISQHGINADMLNIRQDVLKMALAEEELIKNEKSKKTTIKTKKTTYQSDDLRNYYEKAKKESRHVYEVLKEAGIIKDPISEFLSKKVY